MSDLLHSDDNLDPEGTKSVELSQQGNQNGLNEGTVDPFNPGRLRLPQDFANMVGAKKILTTIPVGKPKNSWWVRTHPDREKYWLPEALILELPDENEQFLVTPNLEAALLDEPCCRRRLLCTSITRQGVLLLWTIKLADADGNLHSASQSALQAAEMAAEHWIRIKWNKPLGAYDVIKAPADIPSPEWPEESFEQLLKIAFKDRLIDNLDHAILKQLRGEQ